MSIQRPGLAVALVSTLLLANCAAVVGGTAGGLLVDEGLNENDGEFDPFENTEAARQIEEAFE
ncbi:MAG: hypothetical protein AAGI34_01245 [Pseudomonadota bacterium]